MNKTYRVLALMPMVNRIELQCRKTGTIIYIKPRRNIMLYKVGAIVTFSNGEVLLAA